MKIYGIKYANGDVIRAKGTIRIGELDPFFYCCIRDIYVYGDEKIFNVEALNIL